MCALRCTHNSISMYVCVFTFLHAHLYNSCQKNKNIKSSSFADIQIINLSYTVGTKRFSNIFFSQNSFVKSTSMSDHLPHVLCLPHNFSSPTSCLLSSPGSHVQSFLSHPQIHFESFKCAADYPLRMKWRNKSKANPPILILLRKLQQVVKL